MAAKKFTLQEQIFLITCYCSLSYDLVLLREEFKERFPNTAFPLYQMLYNKHRKFQRTGSATDAPRNGRPHDAATLEGFCSTFVRNAKKFKKLVVTLNTSPRNTYFCTASCTYKFVFVIICKDVIKILFLQILTMFF